MYIDKKVSATMRERKRLDFSLQLKSLDREGRFSGYASVFNIVDNQSDIMLRGAFASATRKPLSSIKFLWQHQQEEPIGILTKLSEDEHGLYVEGMLLLNVQRANEAYTLLKAGAISGLSIGYSPLRYTIDPQTGVRLLAEVDLWEISIVTFPANSDATISKVKAMSYAEEDLWESARRSGELVKLSDTLDNAIAQLCS